MEATGHYWKNLFALLTAAGHGVALLNLFSASRFQDAASSARRQTPSTRGAGAARFREAASPPSRHAEAAEACESSSANVTGSARTWGTGSPTDRPVDLGFPEFTRYAAASQQAGHRSSPNHPTAKPFARRLTLGLHLRLRTTAATSSARSSPNN